MQIIAIDIREASPKKSAGKGVYNLELTLELIKNLNFKWILLTDSTHVDSKITELLQSNKNISLKVITKKSIFWHLEAKKFLLNNKIDIFLAPTSFLTPYFLRNCQTIKTYIFIHDLICFLFPKEHPIKPVIIEKFCLPRIVNKVTGIFVVSNSTKKDLLTIFPNLNTSKVHIAYCAGSHYKPLLLPTINTKKIITAVSTLLPRKNFHSLIIAFNQVKDLIPHNVELVGGVGSAKYADFLISLIKKHNLEQRVFLRGFMSSKDLSDLYLKSDFVVYPSKYEGFGIPILEAFQHNCPVLVANNSSLPEVAGAGGIYFDPNNLSDFAQKILNLASNQELKKSLVLNSKMQLQKYSWTTTAKQVLDVIQKV